MSIKLTDEQQMVVVHRGSPLRVVAGPGTGKTLCLVARIIDLLSSDHTDPNKILAVTFTRAAAKEMRSRLEREGIPPDRLPDVRTLHSKAVALLRRHGHLINLKNSVRPLSEFETKFLIQDVAVDLEAAGVNLAFKGPHSIYKFLIAYKSEQGGAGIPQWISTSKQRLDVFRTFSAAYEMLQFFYNALDWFRVIRLTHALFDSYPEVLAEEQESVDQLLVDEYQDLNKCEQEIIRRLVRNLRCLCIVGDEDQSIYESQRFADPSGLIDFATNVSGSTTLPLTVCHRCPPQVLDKANALITNNTRRIAGKPPLKPIDPSRKGIVVTIFQKSKKAEIEWLVKKIRDFHSQGCKYGEMLVLFGDGSIAEDYVAALRKEGIPLDVQLRVVGPFDSPCFSSLLAVLRLISDKTDNLALRQCLGEWPNIGAKTILGLRQVAVHASTSLWDGVAVVAIDPKAHPSIARRRSVQDFYNTMTSLMAIAEFDKLIPAILVTIPHCSDDVGVQITKQYFDTYKDKEAAISLSEVLTNFEHEREIGSLEKAPEELPDKVRVMTMHSAKGLEAGVVFIPALEDDLIPGQASNIEERRRLFYVSVTRTKKMLFLSWAAQRSGKEIHRRGGRMLGKQRCRFLNEMKA